MSFTDPTQNINHLNLTPTMKVADLGAGTGAYTIAIAEKVLEGKVYAVEIQKDLLEVVKKDAQAKNLNNVSVVWGDIEKLNGTGLGDGIVNAVVISNILFQISSMYVLAQEIKRILRAGGQVLVVDWSASFGGIGPEAEAVVPPEKVKEVFASVGFSLSQEFPAGDNHYGLIFKK